MVKEITIDNRLYGPADHAFVGAAVEAVHEAVAWMIEDGTQKRYADGLPFMTTCRLLLSQGDRDAEMKAIVRMIGSRAQARNERIVDLVPIAEFCVRQYISDPGKTAADESTDQAPLPQSRESSMTGTASRGTRDQSAPSQPDNWMCSGLIGDGIAPDSGPPIDLLAAVSEAEAAAEFDANRPALEQMGCSREDYIASRTGAALQF